MALNPVVFNRFNKFIAKANAVHKNKYDYSLVQYVNSKTKVEIICPIHGSFFQMPEGHAYGYGCKKCGDITRGNAKRTTKDNFIISAIVTHGKKYDYSVVDYKSAKSNVTIICNEHGEFKQSPDKHLMGRGCRECGKITQGKKKLTTQEFIIRARNTHGEKYDYSGVIYQGYFTKVNIRCKKHGIFSQKPSDHIGGCGCRGCNINGIKLNNPGILYYIKIINDDIEYWKIGVTNNTIEKRFGKKEVLNKIKIVRIWNFDKLFDGFRIEQEIIREFGDSLYTGTNKLLNKCANTEIFTNDVLCLDSNQVI